eukprot:5505368-Amphidinium_carterae.1
MLFAPQQPLLGNIIASKNGELRHIDLVLGTKLLQLHELFRKDRDFLKDWFESAENVRHEPIREQANILRTSSTHSIK